MLLKYSNKELDKMARLMRAEALSDGELAMLMVGNVIVNRAIANCLDFKATRTISDVINQKNAFTGYNSKLYNSGSSTTKEKELAKRALRGETYYPATHALWYYNPGKNKSCKEKWFKQQNIGKYKSHCFYVPQQGICNELY